jgi:hypothetical protein
MIRINALPIFWMLIPLIAGCRTEAPTKNEAKPMDQPTVVKKIPVVGFDPDGEPEIRLMSDGTMIVAFNFMPPSFDEDGDRFADFDKQLEKALNVPVHWEDRELFRVQRPANDSAEKAKAFLEGYNGQKKGNTR